jgi:hypothetical protein
VAASTTRTIRKSPVPAALLRIWRLDTEAVPARSGAAASIAGAHDNNRGPERTGSYSTLSFAFATAVVYHFMFPGASAPPRFSGMSEPLYSSQSFKVIGVCHLPSQTRINVNSEPTSFRVALRVFSQVDLPLATKGESAKIPGWTVYASLYDCCSSGYKVRRPARRLVWFVSQVTVRENFIFSFARIYDMFCPLSF